MIFISGVHGVGKSYFCNIVKDRTGIESYSASKLITERKKQGFPASKLIPDIDENQQYLLTEEPDIIASRRKGRDGIVHPVKEIKAFQDEESLYAEEVSKLLGVPLKISKGSTDTEATIDFITSRRTVHGR